MIYKESGIEWIGQVPNHWHTLSVSKAYDVTLGKMLQPNSNDENDVKVPYLKAMNVQDGYVSFEKIEEMYCSINELNNYKLECGDLVVCEGGEVARSAVIKENLAGFIFQNSVHRVKGTAKGDTRFLHYLLIALRASGFINILVNKATIAHFTKDKFNSLKIALPQLNEQLKISDYLDYKTYKIETLIKAKQMLIDLLEQQRQSIITEAVTKGLNPNVKMKDSGVEWIGEIPEHWEATKIKYSVELQGVKAEDDTDLQYIGLENIEAKTGKYIPSENVEIDGAALKFLKGDVLFGKLRPYLAKVLLADFDGRCSTEILVLKVLEEVVLSQYLKYVLLSSNFIDEVNSSTYGSKMPRANWSFIGNIFIPLPPLNEQKAIIGEIMEVEKRHFILTRKLKEQIEKLKEYRQALIYEAVTGKIDVRDMELD